MCGVQIKAQALTKSIEHLTDDAGNTKVHRPPPLACTPLWPPWLATLALHPCTVSRHLTPVESGLANAPHQRGPVPPVWTKAVLCSTVLCSAANEALRVLTRCLAPPLSIHIWAEQSYAEWRRYHEPEKVRREERRARKSLAAQRKREADGREHTEGKLLKKAFDVLARMVSKAVANVILDGLCKLCDDIFDLLRAREKSEVGQPRTWPLACACVIAAWRVSGTRRATRRRESPLIVPKTACICPKLPGPHAG